MRLFLPEHCWILKIVYEVQVSSRRQRNSNWTGPQITETATGPSTCDISNLEAIIIVSGTFVSRLPNFAHSIKKDEFEKRQKINHNYFEKGKNTLKVSHQVRRQVRKCICSSLKTHKCSPDECSLAQPISLWQRCAWVCTPFFNGRRCWRSAWPWLEF